MPPFIAPLHFGSRPLPPRCEPATDFLYSLSATFGSCIPTNLAFFSTVLGTCSIVSWLFAQLPQIYRNHKLQSTSGLSIFFLTEWLLGDLSNLLGSMFTRQATWQVIIAIYYVFVDCALCGQWVWYALLKHGRPTRPIWRTSGSYSAGGSPGMDQVDEGTSIVQSTKDTSATPSTTMQASDKNSEIKPQAHIEPVTSIPRRTNPITAFRMPSYTDHSKDGEPSSSSSRNNTLQVPSNLPMPSPSPRTVLYISLVLAVLCNGSTATSISPFAPATLSTDRLTALAHQASASSVSATEIAGQLLSWLSTALYLGSRLPQLYMNHVRKSTAGLSPALFAAAFFGNLFYSTSILTNPCGWYDFTPGTGRGWVDTEGSVRRDWILRAAPFFLGAAGVLAMDAAVGVQFLLYGEKDVEVRGRSYSRSENVTYVTDAQGVRKHVKQRLSWRRASGWMRGWVPAVIVAGTPSSSRASTPAGEASTGTTARLLSPGSAARACSISSTSSARSSTSKTKSIPIQASGGALDEARALLREGVRHASPRSYGGV